MSKLLGKLPAKSDPRIVLFARHVGDIKIPKAFNFWKKRAVFPPRTFGNTSYGSCTRASQAILAMRMERIETKKTPKITDEEVVARYLAMTEELYGGGDTGAYEMDALDEWRRPDKTFRDTKGRALTIDAYTRINHLNLDEVRTALYLAGAKGIKVCFDLPSAWKSVNPPNIWDIPSDWSSNSNYWPGSWGGHSMSADAYTEEGVRVVHTWYTGGVDEQLVSWRAFAAYCSEAYLVIDSFDGWRKRLEKKGQLDVQGIVKEVNKVSSHKVQNA